MKLGQSARRAARQGGLIRASVVDTFGSEVTVRLVSNGAVYHNLAVVGGVVGVGQTVLVDFSVDPPVAYSSYHESAQQAYDRTRPLEPIAHMNTWVPPSSGSSGSGPAGEPGSVTYNWLLATAIGGAIGDYSGALGNSDAYFRLFCGAGPYGISGWADSFYGISMDVALLVTDPLYNTAFAIWGCPKDCASVKITPVVRVYSLNVSGRNLTLDIWCYGYSIDDTTKDTRKFYSTKSKTWTYNTATHSEAIISCQMVFSDVAAGDIFYLYSKASATSRSSAGSGTLWGYIVELVDAA